MKLLSIAIPCYNSENYMRNCIHSLLVGGEEVEIIIVDDGSTDGTAAIADEYAEKYPSIIKAVHQENGGHGEAVNTGLRNATGLYFKVVDSDDWVSISAYKEILKTLENLAGARPPVDMLISNFVYEKEGQKRKKIMSYRSAFPQDRVFTWDDVKFLLKGQYILMHSVIYRTKLLRECELELPKHTFYVDNIFVYHPLPYVKYLYYMNVNFYRYYIGREDQSVNEKVMISRLDQQLKVNYLMIDDYKLTDSKQISNRKLRHYMKNYLEIIMVVSSIIAIRSGTKENLEKKYELWKYLKKKDPKLYYELKWGIMGRSMNLPGRSGRKISETAYKIANKFVGFN
ncbi:glycosyltransferase family 2 protein [Candidatus Merdisoma sp. JLR.KK011]|uniref:glycosyltransferase family 2 protein n=1 Tax=Candidatus Merdisoma sp. JLR.KK011 TaxID=3114299 RepID=UPI002FF25694